MIARGIVLAVCMAFAAAGQTRLAADIPMRDGVRLSTNVFLPASAEPVPTLLLRTPYGKRNYLLSSYHVFLDEGYAVVVQDVRGRYASGGRFRPLTQESPDSDDTIRWIVQQPWSNGKVGMLGGSYLGIVQWRAALTKNPNLWAIFPVVSGNDEYFDRFYSRGGALKLGHRLLWIAENLKLPRFVRPDFESFVRHLPLRTADRAVTGTTIQFWQDALDHPSYDAYWQARSTRWRIDEIRTPAFIVGGWYDNFIEGDLEAFASLSRRSAAHRIVVGPWGHNMSAPFPSGIGFGSRAFRPIRRYQLDWFHYWMRTAQPAPAFDHPPVRIFVMGSNEWRDEREWPLRRTQETRYYLTSRRGANSLQGDGALVPKPNTEGEDEFTYDPRIPVPTRGGAICCNPKTWPWGPMDQRSVETRDDVLVYSTAPLREDVEVTGSVRVVLHVSTTAPDTDFTAKLVDVFPDGQARNLCDGILRLRYRDGLDKARLASSRSVYEITIRAGVTSNVFRRGHRIRLEISSSNFPRFDRNPNTGRVIADERELRVARQSVYHGQPRPSHIVLPVIPSGVPSEGDAYRDTRASVREGR
jgi:putative CocE/NonD family hydrolase